MRNLKKLRVLHKPLVGTYSPTHNFHLTCINLNEDNRKTGIRRENHLRIPVFRLSSFKFMQVR